MKALAGMILTEIEGEYYAVPTGAADRFSGMIRMNSTGKRVFELLAEGLDASAVANMLTEEYDVDQATAEKNVKAIVARLQDAGLL